MNYTDADALLTGRCKERRKIDNNTYLERRGDNIAVRLHATDVVTLLPNGDQILNTGGWLTPTTKDRLNKYSRAAVCSHKGRWEIGRRWMNEQVAAYADGMVLHADGTMSGCLDLTEAARQDEANRQMRRNIAAFVASITPEQIVHQFENSQGDCFLCRAGSDSCLEVHVEERYFHATLMHRAVVAAHFAHPDFIMQRIYADAQRGRIDEHLVRRTLGKFLRKNLLTGVATR